MLFVANLVLLVITISQRVIYFFSRKISHKTCEHPARLEQTQILFLLQGKYAKRHYLQCRKKMNFNIWKTNASTL